VARKETQCSQEFKFKAALEAARGQATIQEIASRIQVHPNQARSWKSKLIEERSGIFDHNTGRATNCQAVLEVQLFKQSGRLKVGRGVAQE
jgi:transposase-like protein